MGAAGVRSRSRKTQVAAGARGGSTRREAPSRMVTWCTKAPISTRPLVTC
jgi:hypothetical protein